MRSVLMVMGLAIVAIAIGLGFSSFKSKDLAPNPSERSAERQDTEDKKNPPEWAIANAENFKPPKDGAINVDINVVHVGLINIEVYPKAAPKTVKHFLDLVKSGFYNGIRFHRVSPKFAAEAG